MRILLQGGQMSAMLKWSGGGGELSNWREDGMTGDQKWGRPDGEAGKSG